MKEFSAGYLKGCFLSNESSTIDRKRYPRSLQARCTQESSILPTHSRQPPRFTSKFKRTAMPLFRCCRLGGLSRQRQFVYSKVRDIWAPGGDRCRWVSNVVLVVCVSASLTILQPPLLISLFLRHAVLIDEPPAVELGGLGVSVPTWHTHVSRFDAPRACTRAYAPIRQCFIPFHAPRPARAPCTGS